MRHDHLSVVLDFEINSSEVLVFDGDSVEFIEKSKLRDTMKIRSVNFQGRPD
jgi:hypothetical protein